MSADVVVELASRDFQPATCTAVLALAYNPRATPVMERLAGRIAAEAGARTSRELALAVYDWVRVRVRYRRDPHEREFIRTPASLALAALRGTAAGDCDDHAALVMALAAALGLPTRLILTRDRGRARSRTYHHIHTEVEVEGGWLPLDTSLDWVPRGARAPGAARVAIYPADLPDEVLFLGREDEGLGFVSTAIRVGGGLVGAAIDSQAAKSAIRAQKTAAQAVIAAQERLETRRFELDAAAYEAERERLARLEAEAAHREELREWSEGDTSWSSAATEISVIGLGIAVVSLLLQVFGEK